MYVLDLDCTPISAYVTLTYPQVLLKYSLWPVAHSIIIVKNVHIHFHSAGSLSGRRPLKFQVCPFFANRQLVFTHKGSCDNGLSLAYQEEQYLTTSVQYFLHYKGHLSLDKASYMDSLWLCLLMWQRYTTLCPNIRLGVFVNMLI